jgi:hypothetical protein
MNLRRPLLSLSALLVACADPSGGDTSAGTSTGVATSDAPTTDSGVTTGSTGDDTTGSTGDGATSSTSTTTEETGEPTTDASTGDPPPPPSPEQFWLLEDVVFYDGYAATVDEPIPEGVIRHNNALVATPMTDEHLAKIQTTLRVGVIVGALCDNYDRIGAVNLALVPKGAATYVPAEVDRIEVARFITPFMDMNKDPKTVPYEWAADHIVPILKDPEILAEYDLWFELSVFGVPYAANDEIAGCAGRNDTQLGSLGLYTTSAQPAPAFSELLPLAINEEFNNYAEGASDDDRHDPQDPISFELANDTPNAQLVLITSNHGANEGGEEYIRREHYVYIDGKLVLQYKPGRTSCEPFRKYNTQGNGIYGPSPEVRRGVAVV